MCIWWLQYTLCSDASWIDTWILKVALFRQLALEFALCWLRFSALLTCNLHITVSSLPPFDRVPLQMVISLVGKRRLTILLGLGILWQDIFAEHKYVTPNLKLRPRSCGMLWKMRVNISDVFLATGVWDWYQGSWTHGYSGVQHREIPLTEKIQYSDRKESATVFSRQYHNTQSRWNSQSK